MRNKLVIPITVTAKLFYNYLNVELLWFNLSKQETLKFDFKLVEGDILRFDMDIYVKHLCKKISDYTLENNIINPFTFTQLKELVNKVLNSPPTIYNSNFTFEMLIEIMV